MEAALLRAGTMRERVTIQSVTLTKDDYHEQVETWADGCTVKASVRPDPAFEGVVSDRLETEQRLVVTIRHRGGVTVKNRLKHVQNGTARYYDVISVNNRGFGNRVLDLFVSYKQDNQV